MTKIQCSNYHRFKDRWAFTLMELMIVVIVVGIIAAFAIPSYQKAVDRAYERQGLSNMILIAAAQEAYKARHGEYWPPLPSMSGNQGITALNADLKLNIVPGNDSYACCAGQGGNLYECYARHDDANGILKWQLKFNDTMISNFGTSNPGACCDGNYSACPTIPFNFSANVGACF